jgi:quercetin dioxygenase-like cupin family protein
MSSDAEEQLLHRAIAASLTPIRPGARRQGDLRRQLFDRVRHSALAHQEYLTVRTEDGVWRESAAGTKHRSLRNSETFLVEVGQLAAGALLRWPDRTVAQEILVLSGALAAADAGTAAAAARGPMAYHVRHRSDAGEPLHAIADTAVYVRHLQADLQRLPPLEARWWRLPGPASGWVDAGRNRWRATSDGVDVLPLRGDAEVVSMLVRFAPGASVSDHHHALDEDCLVLEGEMFLGDILLRAGDYQLAPAGGSHFGETSDVGVVFFFHGALDPVLRGQRTG